MQNRIEINELFDYYGSLLTDKQQQICQYYYRQDLSLQEIAQLLQISRSAVHDVLKHCQKDLYYYEEKLHLVEKSYLRETYYKKMESIGNKEIQSYIQKCRDSEGGEYE